MEFGGDTTRHGRDEDRFRQPLEITRLKGLQLLGSHVQCPSQLVTCHPMRLARLAENCTNVLKRCGRFVRPCCDRNPTTTSAHLPKLTKN